MKPILPELDLVTKGEESAWAVTSADNRFRYILGRTWRQSGKLWVYCACNPSYARHDRSDHTLAKFCGFADRGGAGGIVVVNAMAFSTPYPVALAKAARAGVNVVGEHNLAVLTWAASLGERRIACWGRIPPSLQPLTLQARVMFTVGGVDCFGLNKDGSPMHPLMLPYETPIVRLGSFVRDMRARDMR